MARFFLVDIREGDDEDEIVERLLDEIESSTESAPDSTGVQPDGVAQPKK